MTQKTKAPLTVAKGLNENDSQGATTEATTPVIIPTFEELKKENELLKLKLSVIPEDLESKIEYFNKKKDLIRKLGAIKINKENLYKHIDNIAQLAAVNDFSNERYFIVITDKENYRDNEVFKIANPVIVGDVLSFILDKMEAKETQLKEEIEA